MFVEFETHRSGGPGTRLLIRSGWVGMIGESDLNQDRPNCVVWVRDRAVVVMGSIDDVRDKLDHPGVPRPEGIAHRILSETTA